METFALNIFELPSNFKDLNNEILYTLSQKPVIP